MLSKFSVKKPYTVVVGIVLVLILGFVSFSNMTADLLPNINLPYAVVITTYPGASPSMVEETVSKPIEQAMATVSNIEEIQSVSSENMSMVILQFSQTSDMDSVSLEMRESLDQIRGYWDDSVGNPVIMKLNPNMLPVFVAAVQKDGLDSVQITDYTDREILSGLESLEGVASVSESGTVEESVQVILRQDKIDRVNEKIQAAMENKFAKATVELKDKETELNDAKQELENGKSQLESGKSQMGEKLSGAKEQLTDKQQEVLKGEMDINNNLVSIAEKEAQIQTALDLLSEQEKNLQDAKTALEQLPQKKNELTEQLAQVEAQLDDLEEKLMETPDDESIQAQIVELTQTRLQLQASISALEAEIQGIPAQKEILDQGLKQLGTVRSQLETSKSQLSTAKKQLETAKAQIASGKVTLQAAINQLNQQEITATIQMASAEAKLAMGEMQLQQGEAQLESGKTQLEEQKEKALKEATVDGKLTAETIKGILTAQNFSMPAGYVAEEGISYLVRVGDKFEDAEAMESLVLLDMDLEGLEPVRLSDVADVAVINNADEVYASINGQPGIMLSIQKQTGYSTGEVSDRIQEYFAEVMEKDSDVHVTTLMDQGIYIDMVVDSVLQNLLMGALLAVLILFLFLRDVRPTFIVACSIPISVLTAIVLMYFSGITLNIISLSGLALGVGMLVDNSIVVIENIYRLRGLGKSVKEAAIEGAKQMTGAIIASTLTTVCVFLPIVFMEGITRQLFVDMGLTIAYSLVASLAVALTLVPMMAAGTLKKQKEVKTGFFTKLLEVYGRFLEKALKLRIPVLLAAAVLLVLSIWLALSKGTAFMPQMESTQSTVTITLPEGSSVKDVGEMSNEIMNRLQDIEDIEEMGAMAGGSSAMGMLGGGSGSDTSSTLYLILSEDKKLSNDELNQEILQRTEDLDCEVSVSSSSMDMSALGGSGIQLQIKGKELDKLQEIAQDVAALLKTVEGTAEVSDGMEKTTDELRLMVNRDKASEYNLTVAQVYQQIAAKIASVKTATTLSTESKDYPVTVIEEAQQDYTREDVKNFTITATGMDGETKEVPVEELVDFVDAKGLSSIRRDAQSRYMNVTAAIADGYNIGLVSDDVQEALKDYELPEGYYIEMQGEDETIRESMVEVLKMLALAVVFMYLIMVAQFQSLLSPFIVMFTIPLAFTGGFLGLVIAGKEVSVISMLGFVMLSGVIVNNGIVLVDYINQLREEGMEKRKAIVTAGKTRMRPILMTALTTILGLSTLSMGMGMGADMIQPMAIVTTGGLIYGTILTLVVVPCIYDILNRKKYAADITGMIEDAASGEVSEDERADL